MGLEEKAPIGVFDSGLGGLTAVRELRKLLPGEDIIYFGDTGRVPYGTRGRDTILKYARQDLAFLLSQKVKTIIAACGTVSSTLSNEEGGALPVGYTGVVQAAAKAAVQKSKTGRIGVLGTEATIRSGSYQRELAALNAKVQTVAAACPLFVPLVENGHFARDDAMANLAAQEYLGAIKKAEVDVVILGCTHYPLLFDMLQKQFGSSVCLIDPGCEAALAVQEHMKDKGMINKRESGGAVRYYVSDDPERFATLASVFLQEDRKVEAEIIEIERYCLDAMLRRKEKGI